MKRGEGAFGAARRHALGCHFVGDEQADLEVVELLVQRPQQPDFAVPLSIWPLGNERGTGPQRGKPSGRPYAGTTWSSPPPSEWNRSSSFPSSCLRWPRADAVSALPELDIRGILAELVREGVDFLVIGGVAVGYHGHIRATKDVDVVPAPDSGNLERLTKVLEGLDARVEGAEEFESGELPDPLDPEALALRGNWVLLTRLGRLDIMQWIGDDALWEKLAPGAIEDEIGGLPIKMISYEDLVALKEQASRPEDLTDLKRLRQARGE